MSERPEKLYLSAPDDDQEHEIWFDPDEGGTEYVRADRIAALEAQLAERVKVKQLEWSGHPAGGEQALAAGLGLYRVHANGDDWYLVPDHMGKGGTAAAQADYERRILSALEATPPAPKVTEAQAEVVAKLITKWLGRSWEGLPEGRVIEKGFPVFSHSQRGWGFNGRKGDMIDLAHEALTAAQEAAPKVTEWREITEDDQPPRDVPVLMGCWEKWPRDEWVIEFGLYGSTKGGWIHGRMTHWLPASILPVAPALTAAQEAGKS